MIAVFSLVIVGGGIGVVALFQSDRNRCSRSSASLSTP
jgi:hypothetical protein